MGLIAVAKMIAWPWALGSIIGLVIAYRQMHQDVQGPGVSDHVDL
jgi:hypothetical protein